MKKFPYILLKQFEEIFFYISTFGIAEWLINYLKLSQSQQLFFYVIIGLLSILILLFSNNNIYYESI